MKPVTVGRYMAGRDFPAGFDEADNAANATGFNGWVETEDWIVFEDTNGNLHVYMGRSSSGVVLNDPVFVPKV